MLVLAILGVFAPCIFKGHGFVDGGMLDNVPADELVALGEEKVIAAKFPPGHHDKIKTIYDVVFKSIDLMFDDRDKKTIDPKCFILDINLMDAKVFDIRKIDYCYHIGYALAKEKMDEIKKYIQL